MPIFSVTCHHCFEKTVMIRDTAPSFCPGCREDIHYYVKVINNSTDLNQYK